MTYIWVNEDSLQNIYEYIDYDKYTLIIMKLNIIMWLYLSISHCMWTTCTISWKCTLWNYIAF